MTDHPGALADVGSALYIVVVADTRTLEVDAYGPMGRAKAESDARELEADLAAGGDELADVVVGIVPLQEPVIPAPRTPWDG